MADRFAYGRIENAAAAWLPYMSGAATKVYVALVVRADNDTRYCFPSISTLQKDTGLSRATVCGALGSLVDLELVTVTRLPGGLGAHGYTLATGSEIKPVQKPNQFKNDTSTGLETEPQLVQKLNSNYTHRTKRNNKTHSSRSKLRFTEDDKATADWMFSLIEKLDPGGKKPNLESWANTIRLMREQDNRTDEQIRAVFAWANADSFWQSNVLSPRKLREKFQVLILKQRNEGKNHGRTEGSGGRTSADPGKRYTEGAAPAGTVRLGR